MLRRILIAALAVLLLSGCAAPAAQRRETGYEATFLTLFDTVTTIKGAAESKEAFEETAGQIHHRVEQIRPLHGQHERGVSAHGHAQQKVVLPLGRGRK